MAKHAPTKTEDGPKYRFFNQRPVYDGGADDFYSAIIQAADSVLAPYLEDGLSGRGSWRGGEPHWKDRNQKLREHVQAALARGEAHFTRWWLDRLVEEQGFAVYNFIFDVVQCVRRLGEKEADAAASEAKKRYEAALK
jgi:hypothetical protein